MKTGCEVVFLMSMVLVVVSPASSVLKGESGAVCNENVTRSIIEKEPVMCEKVNLWTEFKCFVSGFFTGTKYEPKVRNESVLEIKCCEGYENQSGICKPQCTPKCKNAYCAKTNVCMCNYGWEGDSCNKSVLCVVPNNSTDTPNERKRPECNEIYRDKVGRIVVNITEHEDAVPCELPLDRQCNDAGGFESVSSKTYVRLSLIVGGIALFSMAIYTVYIVQRKRKSKKKMNDAPAQSGIPLNYMEENTIYA